MNQRLHLLLSATFALRDVRCEAQFSCRPRRPSLGPSPEFFFSDILVSDSLTTHTDQNPLPQKSCFAAALAALLLGFVLQPALHGLLLGPLRVSRKLILGAPVSSLEGLAKAGVLRALLHRLCIMRLARVVLLLLLLLHVLIAVPTCRASAAAAWAVGIAVAIAAAHAMAGGGGSGNDVGASGAAVIVVVEGLCRSRVEVDLHAVGLRLRERHAHGTAHVHIDHWHVPAAERVVVALQVHGGGVMRRQRLRRRRVRQPRMMRV
mmetsp:Transcript_45540/g.142630  ORF Transcript_45540/g.142630 Transcript_45540/m.142630 type:complete len:263 (+) Transcript_45540:858-1646(+)